MSLAPPGISAFYPLAKNIKPIFRLNDHARVKHRLTASRTKINYVSRGLALYRGGRSRNSTPHTCTKNALRSKARIRRVSVRNLPHSTGAIELVYHSSS